VLTFLEANTAFLFAFAISYSFLSEQDFRHPWVWFCGFIGGHGILLLPFFRMNAEYNGVALVWWHFYIKPWYPIMLLAGVLGAAFYYWREQKIA